ncbi:MAG TPA: hypothetical protein VN033_01000 [Vulgatibacter sp.]|nr:hypothetical protein [Vulgatibacter sp.]
MKQDWDSRIRYDTPAQVDDRTRRKIEECARDAFVALGCRDVARIDFRMDDQGRIYFLECNPLPGPTPGWSDLVLIAKAAGMDYRTLIGEILSGAIRRYEERVRERRAEDAGRGRRQEEPREKAVAKGYDVVAAGGQEPSSPASAHPAGSEPWPDRRASTYASETGGESSTGST